MAKTTGGNRGRLAEWHYLCRWYSTDNGNTVYAVCGELGSRFGRPGMSIKEMAEQYRGAIWEPLHVVRYRKGEVTNIFYNCYSWNFSEKLTEPKCCTAGGIYPQYAFFDDVNAKEVLKDTFMRHYLPREYCEQPMINSYYGVDKKCFLMYAAKYPAIELLMKIGGKNIVHDIVYGKPYKRVLYLDGKSAAEVFRTDSNTAAIIRQHIKGIDVETLQAFILLRKMFPKSTIDDAVKICSPWNANNYTKTIAVLRKTGLTPTKYYNYIEKQGGYGGCWHNPTAADGLYYDYIKECEQLKYDLKDSQINRPKDLRAAHERTSSAVNAYIAEQEAKKFAEKQQKYAEIYQKYVREYEYSDGEFCIVVPKSAAEIIKEGKDQHHCVAGYAERHITGKLAILFMRRCDKPQTALYTIEMNKHKVVQIRGAHNITKMTDAEKLFWKRWQEWCNLPMTEKHPKNKKKSA
ncbi:MAG: PcfJ domain-containing protein [Oscillospiraceae bacterium]